MASSAGPLKPAPHLSSRESVTTQPTSITSQSLKRSSEQADLMAVEGLLAPLRRSSPKRKRKARHLKEQISEPLPLLPALPSSSSLPLPKSDSVIHMPSEPMMSVKATSRGNTYPPHPPPRMDRSVAALCEKLVKANDEIAHLKHELHTQIEVHRFESDVIRQDMYLDMLMHQEKEQHKLEKLERLNSSLKRAVKEQEEAAKKHKEKLKEEESRASRANADLTFYKSEAEHLQTLNKVMEEDMDELRKLENEEAARRKRTTQGLPPAYGSLDEEDRYPTLKHHEDSGSFDVASFKRSIRDNFMRALNQAYETSDRLRREGDYVRSDPHIFVSTSFALSEASQCLRTVLQQSSDEFSAATVDMLQRSQVKDVQDNAAETAKRDKFNLRRQKARRDYVADRVAKALIDLSWRIVSATQLRCVSYRLTPSDKARVDLAYTEADECLLEALRASLTGAQSGSKIAGKDALIWEYQHYYTQISALRKALFGLGVGISYAFFNKSYEWLGDQVDTERMNQANRSRGERAQQGGGGEAQSGIDASSQPTSSGDESSTSGE